MKKHIIIIVLFILNTLVAKSQTEEKYLCFSDINLSYVHSSKGGSGYYKANMQTIIPYGIGLSGTFKICKKIYIDIGLTYKKEGEKNETWYTSGISGALQHNYSYSYYDMPLNLYFNFIEWKNFNFLASSGFKGTICLYQDEWNPYYYGFVHNEYGSSFGIAYSFGLMEKFKLTDHFEIFASQNYGRYLRNKYTILYKYGAFSAGTSWQFFEWKIGIAYKFNKSTI